MAKVTIKDFMIQLGFDSTAVDAGLKKVSEDVKALSTAFVGLATKQKSNNESILSGVEKVNAAKAKQLALDKQLGQSAGTTIIQGGGNSSPREVSKVRTANNQIGPNRKDARRLRATQRAENVRAESAAHAENNKRIRDGISLADKKMMIQADLDRRLQAIGHKYGHNNKELQESAKHMTTNKKQADSFVKSVSQAQSSIKRMKGLIEKTSDPRMLKRLNQEIKDLAVSNKRLNQSIDTQAKKMTASKFAADGLKSSVNNLARSYVSIFAITGAGVASGALGQQLIATKASLLAASGGAEQAAIDFKFLQEQSEHFGVALTTSAKAYTKIGVAAKLANLTMEQTRDIFISANEASVAFGLTGDEVSGVFKAFSDILS